MRVMIVEKQEGLANLWRGHLERGGAEVSLAHDAERAIRVLNHEPVEVLVINLTMDAGEALSIADYAAYRRPNAKVVFVTSKTFFSDGSIFQHATNAVVMLPADTPPQDLAAVVEHYAASATSAS